MDFTHGRRENSFFREEKLEEEKNIYERSSTGGGDGHSFLPITSSVSSSSSAIILQDGSDASPSNSPATALPTTTRGVEKEQMFEKVVTPSDVGKLNRLVIPKQHAEKYFPLDASTHDKGLLLNFEDRSGKPWRFRYSYWNSSQSYVMTKGWSRFVKEKRLDAGDTISFGRGVGDAACDRLFIDWKRRQDQHFNPSASLRVSGFPAYIHSTHPTSPSSSPATHHHPYVSFSRSAATPWAANRLFVPNATPTSTANYFYLRSAAITAQPQPIPGGIACPPAPMVLDSFPIAHGKAGDATKRVRLFGVNLEQPREAANNPESAGLLRLQLRSPDLHLREVDSSPSASSSSSSTRGAKASINWPPLDF